MEVKPRNTSAAFATTGTVSANNVRIEPSDYKEFKFLDVPEEFWLMALGTYCIMEKS